MTEHVTTVASTIDPRTGHWAAVCLCGWTFRHVLPSLVENVANEHERGR
jgi:hypothetical protein